MRSKLSQCSHSMIAVALSVALSVEASAQFGNTQPPPFLGATNKPKLSPYLDLLRNDDSALSPYHSFVLPRREIAQRQAMQAIELRRLDYEATRRSPSKTATTPRFTTGRGGTFQSTLHFFPATTNN